MSTEMRPCEAPIHVPGCNGQGETVDHFTPKCIAKLLEWTQEQIDAEENQQHLSVACHTEKDRTTPQRLSALKRQLSKNGHITLEDVRRWSSKSWYNEVYRYILGPVIH